MANFVTASLNRIISAVRGVSVKLGDKLEYDATYTALDLTGNQLVTKNMLVAAVGAAAIVIEVDCPAGESTDLDYYNPEQIPLVTVPGLWCYAEQYYTDAVIDPTSVNIFIPYTVTSFKVTATNHILFRKSDPGDHIKITVAIL